MFDNRNVVVAVLTYVVGVLTHTSVYMSKPLLTCFACEYDDDIIRDCSQWESGDVMH